MAKRLVDIDEKALAAARAELGTRTLKDTVNEALRRAAPTRDRRVAKALHTALEPLAAGGQVARGWHPGPRGRARATFPLADAAHLRRARQVQRLLVSRGLGGRSPTWLSPRRPKRVASPCSTTTRTSM